jgi:predicted MPP superfamily phosphohydrolase
MVKRRAFLLALGGSGIAAAGVFRFVEPTWFDVTHTRVRLPGVRPKRILHIADIHMSDGMTAPELDIGLRAGLAEKPDIICLTGDFVSISHGYDRMGLRDLLRRAADTAPTYAVLGNHDGGTWLARYGGSPSPDHVADLLTGAGVRLLHNQSTIVDDVTLVGLGDVWSGLFDGRRAFEAAPRSAATVVMCHNPDGKDLLSNDRWDLMLSGHTHGGQARIPGLDPPWTPVLDKRFVAGLYQWEGRRLFITRGLGSPNRIRAFCRPEASILHIG